jgi:FAD:protein FMN transferase
MKRRDFLHPRRLAQTAGQVLAALDVVELSPPHEPVADVPLLRAARQAMATTFEVLLPAALAESLPAAEAALDVIDRLEAQLTVYRDDSEVSRLNQRAAAEPVEVEEGLFGLLCVAARISAETQGAFDVTAGALIKAWGFFRGPRRVPGEWERRHVQQRVGMTHVELDPERRTVRFRRPGLEINLGSIGKGYALDVAARTLRDEWNVQAGLLHGGHSSVYAIGNDPASDRGWQVALKHPWETERRLGVLRLSDRALGTSAATFRHLVYDGRKLGHVIDPRTGWPGEGMASATVTAPTAAEADALATAFYLLGVEAARAYCTRRPDVGAVLLPVGAERPVVLGFALSEMAPAKD